MTLAGEFCSKNVGTIWQVQYKFSWTGGGSGYIPGGIYVQYPVLPNTFDVPCAGYQYSGGFPNYPAPNTLDSIYTITWWTQCYDPTNKPIYNALGYTIFDVDVTFPGGDNLGTRPATDWTGSSCPVSQVIPIATPPPSSPPSTPPSNLVADPVCFGVTAVNFSWNLGTNRDIWLDVGADSNFNNFWNVHVGNGSNFTWSSASTLSQNKSPDPSTQYYWRLWDGFQHTNGSSFVTRNCGNITLNNPSTSCSGTNAIIDFSWTSTTGGSQYQMWRDGVYFATANGTSWRYNATVSDQGQSHQWYVYDAAAGSGSSAQLVRTPSCQVSPSPTPTNPPPTCDGAIIGTKWDSTDNRPFDTVNGLPGATVTISGNGVNNTFGPSVNPYSKGVPCQNYSVSVTGVSGWQVHAEVSGDGSANGVYPASSSGSGTSVNVPVGNSQTVSVWFYFSALTTSPTPTPSPTPSPGPDLIVDSIQINGTLTPGSPLTFTGRIGNIGGQDVDKAFGTEFRLAIGRSSFSEPSNSFDEPRTDGTQLPLRPLSSTTETSDPPWNAELGTHTAKVCTDWINEVAESNESNNCRTLTFTISAPSPSPSPCTAPGAIIGSKWDQTGSKPFDTQPGNTPPGATVRLDGGTQTEDGPETADYTFTGLSAGSHTVSVTGVSGWRVHAEVSGDGSANGVHPESSSGVGTSVNVPVACNQTVSVWFYFAQVVSSPTPYTPPRNLRVEQFCSGGNLVVSFRWISGSEPELWLDVSQNNFAGISNVNVSGQARFDWSVRDSLTQGGGGPAPTPQFATTYQWRLWDTNHGQPEHWHFPTPASFTTLNSCASPTPSPTPTPTPTPPACVNGTISGTKWSVADNKPFDTNNGLPGAIVRIDGSRVAGVDVNPYSQSVTASAGGTLHTVSVSGVSGWTVYAIVSGDGSANGVHPTSSSGAGTSVNVPVTCNQTVSVWFYFSASAPSPSPSPSSDVVLTYKSANQTNFVPGDPAAQFTYTVTNNSASAVNGLNVGFWPNGGSTPNCPSAPSTPSNSSFRQAVNLAAGASTDVTFSFAVTVSGTAVAYASYDCAYSDSNWSNNIRQAPTYNYAVVAWFETTGGDVGARGSISVSGTPPNHWQSDYVLAGRGVDSSVAYRRWKLNSYQKSLIVGNSAYDYLHSRFNAEAMRNDRGSCNITSNVSGLVHCSGNVVFGSANSAPTGISVWFIDGSLTIEKDLQLGSSDAVVFVVSGPILVKTAVNGIDGVYVTAGSFSDTDSTGGNVANNTLVVNGAIYANSVNFARILADGNDTTPAERINYRPDFILSLKDLLASVSMLWREVAP